MRNSIKGILFLLIATISITFSSCGYERIDASHEGMKVNLYGDDKGVDQVSLVTGAVWYNPFTTAIYEYPSYVMTVDYKPFTVNAKDGSVFVVDPTVSLKMIDGKGPEVFKKYRKELSEVVEGTLYNYIKDAFRIQINSFTTDEIVSQRALFEKMIEQQLKNSLLKENFNLEQLTSGLQYPATIVAAVNAKNIAVQDAMKAENEVRLAEAQAKKLIVSAQATKEANDLKSKSLTPEILQQMWIEKWDGKLPIYGTVPTLFKEVK